MAAIWEALVDGDKRRLDDDGTLFLLQVFGVGLPPARRLKVRSPQQHGSTDIGFRYDEREMRLGFFFNAGNTASAVAKRDEIYGFWRSLADTPIQLRYTREDNSVRQIDCHVVGVVDMPWNPDENQNGLQNFVVQVEAANPLWYDPVQDSTSFSEADNLDWWLALGTIDADDVLSYAESPTQGQSMGNFANVDDGSPWSIFLRTDAPTVPIVGEQIAFQLRSLDILTPLAIGYIQNSSNKFQVLGFQSINGAFTTGETDYFGVCNGSTVSWYQENTIIGSLPCGSGIGGSFTTLNTWRGTPSYWVPEIPNGAVYRIALSDAQRSSLVSAIDGEFYASKTITYTGSFLTYPIITITGPITDPVLTNVSTGEDLDFTGVTIAGGDTYTIDCRFGYKTVKNAAGVNKIADLTAGSDLATFHLGADPDVNGGANAFTLTGTGTDANTTVTVTYNERFVGA